MYLSMHQNLADRPRVTVHLTVDKKRRFGALAASRGLSESGLLRELIASALGPNARDPAAEETHTELGVTDSFKIWLRPGDGRLLRVRAREREMSYSAYVAALVRAHLRADPPMPLGELAQLESALAEISAVGRSLTQSAAQVAQGQGVNLGIDATLAALRQAVEELRRALREVVKVNRISWESPHAKLAL
jgi:hypothetical protein